jgi:hypothetical protein
VARVYPLTDLVKLVRVYGLLAGTCDNQRTMVGEVSRAWQAREVEKYVPLTSLPSAFFYTMRGRDMLAAELFPDEDIDPESLDVDALDVASLGKACFINTNRLPKLETTIHISVLAANMLLGVRLYGDHGKGVRSVSHDLIIATMLQETLGKAHRYSAIAVSDYEIVDDSYIFTWFGDSVASLVRELSQYIQEFEEAVDNRNPLPEPPSSEIASATAAIMASRLRLTARAAGDQVIYFLDELRRAELRQAGIDVDGPFPERPYMQRDYDRTLQAFRLPGVDHYALREPIRNTLLIAVRDALKMGSKRSRLSGRRGKAVHETHINLPVMEYYVASEAPNSIETVHIASLEMMRTLEKGRRKSLGTMTAHAFRIAALSERVLGRALEPMIVSLALLHDIVEDGSLRVTGFGHSLRRVQFRFGGPMAAMVSELTDSAVISAGASKALKTLEHPHLLMPQAQYDQGRFQSMDLKPTEADVPYTLSGIVIKLIDTVVSMEEGLRDPDTMPSFWRHSAARIHWIQNRRGQIIYPLLERLLRELKESQIDPRKYKARPHHVNIVRLKAGLSLIEMVMSYLDLYATQNLALLAWEYNLTSDQREILIDLFFDKNVNNGQFVTRGLDALLDDAHLQQSVSEGRIDRCGHNILFPKKAELGDQRELTTLLAYRDAAKRRQDIRRELQLDSAEKLNAQALRAEGLLRLFDQRVATCGLRADSMTVSGDATSSLGSYALKATRAAS